MTEAVEGWQMGWKRNSRDGLAPLALSFPGKVTGAVSMGETWFGGSVNLTNTLQFCRASYQWLIPNSRKAVFGYCRGVD